METPATANTAIATISVCLLREVMLLSSTG
jgi:hypothetical protein